MTHPKPVVLCILDGWGISNRPDQSAPDQARTPNFDRLMRDHADAGAFAKAFEGGSHATGEGDYGAGQMRWLARGGDWHNEDLEALHRHAVELQVLIDLAEAQTDAGAPA